MDKQQFYLFMIIDGILFNLFVNSRNRQKAHKNNKNKHQNWKMNFHWKKGEKKEKCLKYHYDITNLTNHPTIQPTIKWDVEVNIENVIIDGL